MCDGDSAVSRVLASTHGTNQWQKVLPHQDVNIYIGPLVHSADWLSIMCCSSGNPIMFPKNTFFATSFTCVSLVQAAGFVYVPSAPGFYCGPSGLGYFFGYLVVQVFLLGIQWSRLFNIHWVFSFQGYSLGTFFPGFSLGTLLYKLFIRYLVVQANYYVPSGSNFSFGTQGFRLFVGYLVVQATHWIPSGPGYSNGIQWSRLFIGHLVVHAAHQEPFWSIIFIGWIRLFIGYLSVEVLNFVPSGTGYSLGKLSQKSMLSKYCESL